MDRLDSVELEVLGFQVNPFRLANGLPPIKKSYQIMDSSEMVTDFDFGRLISWKGKRLVIFNSDQNLTFNEKIEGDVVYFDREYKMPFELIDAQKVLLGSSLQILSNRANQ